LRSLTRTHAPRDPAPSRFGYRLHRLWLTPAVRRAVLFGTPLLALAVAANVVVTRTGLVENVRASAAEMRRMIEERPEFTVRLMAIDGAAPELADDIRTILPLDFPMTSFDLDLGRIRKRVEALDAVKSASVYVRSGGILQIDVVQREAALVWRGPQGLELLDATGHRVAGLDARTDREDLPLIAGEAAEKAVPEALRLFADAGPLGRRIRGLERVGERRWDMILDRGQRIALPETDADLALERVLAMDKAYNLFARDVVLVDMRILARPTIRSSQSSIDYLRKMSSLKAGVHLNE
jgi:cell division protein FtsQ